VADFGQVFFVPHRIVATTEPAAMFGSFRPGVGAGSGINGQYRFAENSLSDAGPVYPASG
jgi:hypothetical protein